MSPSHAPTPPIRRLPELLINQIAAGEVIERPASVVKELLENALDAGARHIQIDIEDGGRRLIRLVDDGHGIAAEELPLAVAPHATSKLACDDDLFAIRTLGFRGEALASIGAVSHLRIASRPADQDSGAAVEVAGDRTERHERVGMAVGTTIEVRDLFFNVPARRKFLRASTTEFGHITEQLARVALAHRDVAFVLSHNGRISKRLPTTTELAVRIGDFFGQELAEHLLTVDGGGHGLGLSGLIAPPAHHRNSARWQYVFLNGRFIRDRQIQHAVREAYRGLMEPARHPVVFLHVGVDPAEVDVNVHPTKIEVRWRSGQTVHSQVLAALRATLRAADLTPRLHAGRASPTDGPSQGSRPDVTAFFGAQPVGAPYGPAQSGGRALPRPRPARLQPDAAPAPWDPPTAVTPVAQLHRMYLVTETEDGIVIIDQHALHERVLYEAFKQRIADHDLESQALLIPDTVELTAAQLTAVTAHAALLHRLGFDVGAYGTETLAIHAIPVLVPPEHAAPLIRDIADLLSGQDAMPTTEVLIHRLLDMMACKAAVKAGDRMTSAEIQDLIGKRHLVDKGTHCPHGRPTALRFTLADLARQFKRT